MYITNSLIIILCSTDLKYVNLYDVFPLHKYFTVVWKLNSISNLTKDSIQEGSQPYIACLESAQRCMHLTHFLQQANCHGTNKQFALSCIVVTHYNNIHQLALNVDKKNYILFSTKNKNCNKSLKIRNVDVSRVSCVKFLGVTIDKKYWFWISS